MWHAHDANPLAAISLPSSAGSGRIRLVAAPMGDRSCADSGWTLTAFSAAMARLDRQQSPPNVSLNLDGGESVALLAWATPRMPWEWINLPGKERWAELGREDEVRRRLRTDLLWLGTATALLDVALTCSIVEAARGGTGQLPTWFYFSFVTWLVAIAGYTAFMGLVRYRAPAAEV